MQVMRHGAALYVGHAGNASIGTSILDPSDPSEPRLVDSWGADSGSRTPKVQVAGDVLLVPRERWPPKVEGFRPRPGPDPARPAEAARWLLDERGPPGERWYAHQALTAGDVAYLGYGQAHLVVLDVSDFAAPRQIGCLRYASMTSAIPPGPSRSPTGCLRRRRARRRRSRTTCTSRNPGSSG